ncbi:ParA family protein [Alicyclobacillus tolerans]|uniref:ParA family protein n=1 Tax=Alicyclobacillus tolerans TaxID=90970 RepID=UPI001F474E11|nr:ParA family protein [Alicyclobacillus tolerans]MCF8567736.1 ParA family protein [Alicyclobacillus tolerans]
MIVFGIQKGGSSKSTSSAITAYMLTQQGYKVLGVDMDPQGNMTSLLANAESIYEFRSNSILEAMKDTQASGEDIYNSYVHKPADNLHVIPAEDLLATFPRWIYTEFIHRNPQRLNPGLILKTMLDKLLSYYNYDFVIIDTPPALGDQTVNALAAGTHVITMFEPSKFCFDALPTFFETINIVKRDLNPGLVSVGILCTIIDARRTDSRMFMDALKGNEFFAPLLFDTIIHRKATTGRISLYGFEQNAELENAIEDYNFFTKELLKRL